uniref:cyclin-dependent kinase n=1 Tax=Sinocyclocheilus rhinocerous TaxID=307959 RepID=A0A673KRJ8_9TELE
MGDEKETWKVKTLDEILQEKKRRRELEEKSDPKRAKNTDDRESKRDTPEEGELRDHRMEITIRNSPYTREDSTEDRGEEDESLAIKPPQQMTRKDKSYHRKEEKRKDKRRRRSLSAEGGLDRLEQQERQRERERKLREQQQKEQREQRELKERERREEERRKERDARRDGTSTFSVTSRNYDRNHIYLVVLCRVVVTVPESRFDHDSEVSGEEEEEEGAEEIGDVTPQSPSHSATPEDNYVPESPPISPVELKRELPKYLPALQGCRSVEEFQCLNRIEEGTYGVVYRAKDKKTDEIVALKRLKMEKEKEGFPITSLREINTILKAQHPNIVTVREIVVGSNMDKIYIVMNYVEHDLKSLMETMKQPFLPGEVKTLMIQLLRGVRHLHDNWILHRDLKTSNLLLSHKGILKIGDFGLAREYGSPLKPYTPVVVTLWYRSPDLLLGAKEYSTAVDMWSVGCIFGELLTQKPLFPGKSEIDQINKVFKDLGSPSEKIWPGYSEMPAVKKMTFTEYPYNNLRKRFGALLSDQGFDLMNKFLTYCPAKRISADEALKHEYFRESPLPIEPSMFPTWPAKSEQQRVKRGTSPRPPEGGQDFSQLGDDDLKDTGFHLTTANQGASKAGPGFSLKF